jgi:hypothetical protein
MSKYPVYVNIKEQLQPHTGSCQGQIIRYQKKGIK